MVSRRQEISHHDFRRMALALSDAVESAHMGHPDFRVGNRIFATIHHDPQHGSLMLTPEQQERLIRDHPAAFLPESGAWGRAGSTRVMFAQADEETLGEALTVAWRNAVAKGPTKSTGRTRSPQRTPRTPGTRSRRKPG